MYEIPASLKSVIDTGRALLVNTKQRKPAPPPKSVAAAAHKKGSPATTSLSALPETDPYKIFVKKCVNEKVKKPDLVKEIQTFIKAAEDAL